MKKALAYWWLGDSLDATYKTYFDALPDKPSGAVKAAQNTFVIALRQAGLLSRGKCGYFFHAGSINSAKINLFTPGTFNLTAPAGDPTFSEGNGCKSNGTTTYFSNPFKTDQYAGIESNITVAIYISESDTTSSGALIAHGAQTTAAGATIELRPVITGNARFNNYSAANSNAVNSNHKALFVHTVDASNQYMYVNGTKTTIASAPVAPNQSRSSVILAADIGGITGFYTKFVAAFFIFDRFTDADELAFRTAWNTYKTAAGVP